ncbi:unnamed protein product, partial [Rotaria magnacalcarata]
QTCRPAINVGSLKPDHIVRATQHAVSLSETFKKDL